MKKFQDIYNPRILRKEIIRIKAKDDVRFQSIEPEDDIYICNCLVETETYSIGIFTGVIYPNLGWEHVLVRMRNRYPTYREMVMAKELFWNEDEVAFQIYPPESQYVNDEKYTLHLWRRSSIDFGTEIVLKKRILKEYSKSKQYFSGDKKDLCIKEKNVKRLFVFGEMCWPSWEELCSYKSRYWTKEEPAVQYHIARNIDNNPEYIIILWDANDFVFPPKELV